MKQNHPLKELVRLQKSGIKKGICSICSANEFVIEATFDRALKDNEVVLIEATANQVNQFGGYTGMLPEDFKNFVFQIAKKSNFPQDKIILAGDHLGPLTWKNEHSETAMEKSITLIRDYVLAGFTKIHLDTSMHLADDDKNKKLDTKVVAERGAILCDAAQKAYAQYKLINPDAMEVVYVVGSEVPIPGGAQEEEEGLQVTKVSDFSETVAVFKNAFYKQDLQEAWENVIAVVVQPGVEFGDEQIHPYDRSAAKDLTNELEKYESIVFEGHSTDYQTAESLKEMVEDGIAILKVGPAVTFAMREAAFALNMIENEMFADDQVVQKSNYMEVLEKVMLKNPDNWKNHYHGSQTKIRLSRRYSYSDRCRYYSADKDVKAALETLIQNLNSVDIPMTLISQYMPIQYNKIRAGKLEKTPVALIKDRIINMIDDYYFATIEN